VEIAEQILFITSMLGIVAMSASGALVAIDCQLDIIGVIVLSVVTTVGGGVMRDVLLGKLPPSLFRESIYTVYLLVATAVAVLLFVIAYFYQSFVIKNRNILLQITNAFDAVGLGAFTIVGAKTAIISDYGSNLFFVVFIGVITGAGGGILRDIMAGQVPVVLRKRIYIVASIAGALLYSCMQYARLADGLASCVSMGVIVVIRMLATYFRWNLPKVVLKDDCGCDSGIVSQEKEEQAETKLTGKHSETAV